MQDKGLGTSDQVLWFCPPPQKGRERESEGEYECLLGLLGTAGWQTQHVVLCSLSWFLINSLGISKFRGKRTWINEQFCETAVRLCHKMRWRGGNKVYKYAMHINQHIFILTWKKIKTAMSIKLSSVLFNIQWTMSTPLAWLPSGGRSHASLP